MIKLFSDVVIKKSSDNNKYKIEILNLEPTVGLTLSNLIRRTLLSFSSSYKVFAFETESIKHELNNIPGVFENTLDISNNLEKIDFAYTNFDDEVYKLQLSTSKEGPVTSGDLVSDGLVISNPEFVLFNKTNQELLEMTFYVRKGTAFSSREYNAKYLPQKENLVILDVNFSILSNLVINVEEYFTAADIKKESLLVTFDSTNNDAFNLIAQTLYSFGTFLVRLSSLDISKVIVPENIEKKNFIDDLPISKRLSTCLKQLNIMHIEELSKFSRNDIKEMKSLGKITFEELETIMSAYNVTFLDNEEE